MKRHRIAPGCFFEPAEDEVEDPVVGVNKSSIAFGDSYYRRHSPLDDVPDNFEERLARMRKENRETKVIPDREVKLPDGFAVSVAYNKSGYQLIPKDDL